MLRLKYNSLLVNDNNNLRKVSKKLLDDNIRKTTDQIHKNHILLNYLPEQNNKKIFPHYFNNNNLYSYNYFLLLLSFFAGYQFRYYIQRKIT